MPTTLSQATYTVYRSLTRFSVKEITLHELARLAGVSKSKVRAALLELEDKGIATIEEG